MAKHNRTWGEHLAANIQQLLVEAQGRADSSLATPKKGIKKRNLGNNRNFIVRILIDFFFLICKAGNLAL